MPKTLFNILLKNKNLAPMTNHRSRDVLPFYANKINQSLISLTFNQASIGLLTGLLCAALIWYRLEKYVNVLSVNVWFATIFVITLLRAALVKIYLARRRREKQHKLWRHLFIIGATLGGISWGLVAFMLLPYVNSNDHILILMIIAGITAGAVAFIAGVLPAAYLYLVTALMPLSLHFALTHTDYLVSISIFIYLIFLMIQANKIHAMLQNGLLLQFELQEAKDHDPLTNAANRSLFNSNLEQAIKEAKKAHTKIALLYFDLDKFKSINDEYGHQVGDQVLICFVDRLKSIFKDRDMIARLGGDEFTVIINKLSDREDIETIVRKVNNVLEAPAYVNNKKIKIQSSFGVSVYPIDGLDMETLLNVADNRMYSVKKSLLQI